jgi:hypothetical protein
MSGVISMFNLMVVALLFAAQGTERPADAVNDAFEQYKSAVLANEGHVAAQVVNEATIAYFEEITQLAVCGSSSEVAARSAIDRMQIAIMRHRIPAKQLVNMSGRESFVYAVDHGWVGKNTIELIELGGMKVSEDVVEASIVLNGKTLPGAGFRFVKEDGSWKFDLVPVLASGESSLRRLAETRGVPENDLILQLLEAVSGVRPGSQIWEPVAPNDGRCKTPL